MKIIPLSLISTAEYFLNFLNPLRTEANMPANTTGTHCPRANENSIKKAVSGFLAIVAAPIIATSTGDEQGDAVNAKKIPTKNG